MTTHGIWKWRLVLCMAALCLAGTWQAGAATGEMDDAAILRKTSKAFAAIAKKATPAVVSVKVEKNIEAPAHGMRQFGYGNMPEQFGDEFFQQFFGPHFTPRQFKQLGQGSGFLISKDGYILTNNHVVDDADKIRVRLHDGREFDAKRVGTDAKSEIAVIKIEAKDLPYLALGDSDALEIGEWVIAIGSPFGLRETLTVGVVSAKGRNNVSVADYEDFIQTDAAINPGNSGGPLLSIDGSVVGINTAIFSQSGGYMGIGFAVTANMAKSISQQLISHGRVVRGYLGIMLQELTPELADSFGLKDRSGILVADVEDGSPASKAGVRQADVILKLDGRVPENMGKFRESISSMPPGTEVTLQVLRDGKHLDLKAKTGTLPGDEGASSSAAGDAGMLDKIGIKVEELTQQLARQYGYAGVDGVIVSEIEQGNAAESAGIEPGNLITSVNRKPVTSVEQFKAAMRAAKPEDGVLLTVKAGRFSRYVVLKTE